MSEVKLYLLRLGRTDLYKIGISARPCSRLAQIAGSAYPVEIVGVWPGLASLERNLHRKYSTQRADRASVPESGCTEWFRLSAEDVKEIRAECALARMQAEGKDDVCGR